MDTCPHCGKKLQPEGLFALLEHIEKSAKRQEKDLVSDERRVENARDAEQKHYSLRLVESRRKAVEKWRSWAEDLRKLIEDKGHGARS